jgi:hypothetical protein
MVNVLANELMLIVSTISSVLAGIAAVAGEMRVRRRDRGAADPAQTLETCHPARHS